METDLSAQRQGINDDTELLSSHKPEDSCKYAFKLIHLNPGISALNFVCSIINSTIAVFALVIVGMLQPFILVDKSYYNVSQDNAGSITSLGLLVDLLVRMLVLVPYGHIADKFGRKIVLYWGSASFLAACLLTAWQTSIPGFLLAKALFANAACSLQAAPLVADYTADESKGRASGIVILLIGLTMVFGNLFIKLLLYEDLSLGNCYVVTGIVIFSIVLISSFGLKRGNYHAPPADEAENTTFIAMALLKHFKDAAKVFYSIGWLPISLILGVAGTSSSFIFFTYMSLYVKSLFPAGTDDNTANIAVNNIQTFIFIPAFIPTFAYGYLLDKQNRVFQLSFVAMGGIAMSFACMALSTDPADLTLIFAALLMGVSMPGLFVLSNYLSIRNYPADKRGLMTGFMAMASNTIYFLVSSGGGLLYDHWIKTGPFILGIALVAIGLMTITIIYKRKGLGNRICQNN